MALKTKIELLVEGLRTTTLERGVQRTLHSIASALAWPSGTTSSTADEVWSDTRTVAAGVDDNLQLDSLAQLDDADNTLRTVTFTKIKLLAIRNTSAADYLAVGGGSTGAGAADAFAGANYPLAADNDLIHVGAGGLFLWMDPDGVDVTNGATDILNLRGITSSQTYELVLIGND